MRRREAIRLVGAAAAWPFCCAGATGGDAGDWVHERQTDPEIVITTVLLCGTLVVGFATLRDYGIALDEWNADEYGVKALAWYTSGFNDRGMFNDVEETLWYYGPWFQILTTLIQALDIAGHWTTRHAVTLVTGIVGIAMLVPLARRVAGPWAGLIAIILCLSTGYLYGNLFCTPIDIPFLLAMTGATLAIVIMAERTVPSWKATISAGLLTGLAIATRSSGIFRAKMPRPCQGGSKLYTR
jgi:4-amino-4-deoxy-L-arabinose transferase-like glycosyltransferase